VPNLLALLHRNARATIRNITQSSESVYSHFRDTNRTRRFAHSGVYLSRVLPAIWWTKTITLFLMNTQHHPKLRCNSLCRNITSPAPTILTWLGISSKGNLLCNCIHRYAGLQRWISACAIDFFSIRRNMTSLLYNCFTSTSMHRYPTLIESSNSNFLYI